MRHACAQKNTEGNQNTEHNEQSSENALRQLQCSLSSSVGCPAENCAGDIGYPGRGICCVYGIHPITLDYSMHGHLECSMYHAKAVLIIDHMICDSALPF